MHSLDDTLIAPTPATDYPLAGKGKRFANYFLDQIGYVAFSAMIGLGLGVLAELTGLPQFTSWLENDIPAFDTLFGFAVYFIYYVLMEYYTGGKTLGKYLTGTRAIRLDGQSLTLKDATLRSLIRCIPFEPFSFLGDSTRGWHDRWTDTWVVDERSANLV